TIRIRHHLTYCNERRVPGQQVVLQTKRSDRFDILFSQVRRTVVRQLCNSRSCPQVTQRTVSLCGLAAGNIKSADKVALASLTCEFDRARNWTTPFTKQ